MSFAFFKCLYIHHIAGYDIGDKHYLPSGPLQPETPLHQHQGLLFDEEQLCLYFLSHGAKIICKLL
jgi:hypothetical protein